MRKLLIPVLAIALVGCADFVDEDGNTSIRQVAEGLQSLGDRVAEMGEAIERDADVEAVPWVDLRDVIPEDVDGAELLDVEGDDAKDRNGAGMSMVSGRYVVRGDSVFVGVADLGALRSGARLALRWVAPLVAREDVEGKIEEIRIDGHPAIRIRDDEDNDILVALLVEERFAIVAGVQGRGNDDLVREAIDEVDFRQLRRWSDYGME
jgi:hypothetical protein